MKYKYIKRFKQKSKKCYVATQKIKLVF
jgi:hypothetical protein